MLKRTIIGAVALALAAPATAADGWNWHVEKDRLLIDKMLRKIGEQCGQLGFTPVASADPAAMEKRMYASLLLQSSYAADQTVEKWSRWLMTFVNLKDGAQAAGERAGAAVVAASVDPASHEKARAAYAEAFAFPFHPAVASCAEATQDEFVSKNYLTGRGSVESVRQKAASSFDDAVATYNRDRDTAAEKAAK